MQLGRENPELRENTLEGRLWGEHSYSKRPVIKLKLETTAKQKLQDLTWVAKTEECSLPR